MGTYRQTNTIRPTEEQFVELFDLHKQTFWDYAAYTWYDPKHKIIVGGKNYPHWQDET